MKRWVGGVDLTSDRVGFLLADDLQTAFTIVRSASEESASVPVADRVKELFLFAVCPEYLALRESLGIRVDG